MEVAENDTLARRMVEAAEAGETEWPTHEAFVARFGPEADDPPSTLFVQVYALGWNIKSYEIENYEVISGSDGVDRPSGRPSGYRMVRA